MKRRFGEDEDHYKEACKKLLNDISARFLNVPSALFGVEINKALEQSGSFFQLDRMYIYSFSEDGMLMKLEYEWCRDKIHSKKRVMAEEVVYEFPWMMRKIKNYERIVISDMAELPEGAANEREMLSRDGVKSCLIVPLKESERIWGFMGFDNIQFDGVWDENCIHTLEAVASVIFSRQLNLFTEEKLKTQLYEKSLILDNSDVQIWSLKNTTVYGAVNDAHARFFGKNKGVLEHQDLYDIFPPETANMLCKENWDLFQQEGGTGREIWIENSEREMRLLLVKSKPKLDSQGNIEYLVCTAEDITEQRRVQDALFLAKKAAEAANIAKSRFLANMSHEIRTPMNGIVGFMELLERTGLSPEQKEYVNEVRNSSQLLLYLVNDILDFSKIEAEKMELEAIQFDIRSTIESAVMLSVPRAYEKGLEIYTMIKSNVPLEVIGDPGRLRQVLNNLISNSVKFTEKGEVILSVETIEESEEHCLVRFEISDTGIGISDSDLQRLFSPFTQVDASTTRKYGGTGLGLAISQKLVELMGGKISVYSRPGEGSKFSFALRYKKGAYSPKALKKDYEVLSARRILIVDINGTGRKVMRSYLEETGCITVEAENGVQAMNELMKGMSQGNVYDAVVISHQMPLIHAYELAETLKAIPLTKEVPLVLVTAFARKGEVGFASEKGYRAFLTKPIKREELLDCLAYISNSRIADTCNQQGESGEKTQDAMVAKHSLCDYNFETKPEILLVEDHGVNRKLAQRILAVNGFGCDVAVSGKEALEACLNKKYDLIFMDCQMPEMDGYETTVRIRESEGGKRHTPIVAMTANAMEGDREKCLNAGMDDYISKPIRSSNLLSAIEKYCKRR